MKELKIGDIVRQKILNNNAPFMTINYISDDGVRCTYWQPKEQVFVSVNFHPAELEKVA
jgi:hypothetical protein